MSGVIPITEQYQHFVEEVKENFWGDLYARTKQFWKQFCEEQSGRERDRYLGVKDYERGQCGSTGTGFTSGTS